MTLPIHPNMTRRTALQAGSIGLLGLGMNHVSALRVAAAENRTKTESAKSCIFIFLSGGLSQLDSFDMKPDAPDTIRGEFQPIATNTPGIQICEHLPELAKRSQLWALCRSLTSPSSDHSTGHHIMLTGRSEIPVGFSPTKPKRTDYPSLAAIAGDVFTSTTNLPPAIVLPEKLVHWSGRVIPGQFGGQMGNQRDPWFIEAAPYHNKSYGAFPQYQFDHQQRGVADKRIFQTPNLRLPQGLKQKQMKDRVQLLQNLSQQSRLMNASVELTDYDRFRNSAISLLSDKKVHHAMDVSQADAKTLDRYGRNSFGWSLLMARQLVETGVNLVQVNLGNNETWDTHGNAFPHLKDKLFPPTDKAVSALLDDLSESGQLDETLIVMCSEFGRTPLLSTLKGVYPKPGRGHWGGVQTVFFAGGGVKGGHVIGKSDKQGGKPVAQLQRPENMAATIYHALGLPQSTKWYDEVERPHFIYNGDPIKGLM